MSRQTFRAAAVAALTVVLIGGPQMAEAKWTASQRGTSGMAASATLLPPTMAAFGSASSTTSSCANLNSPSRAQMTIRWTRQSSWTGHFRLMKATGTTNLSYSQVGSDIAAVAGTSNYSTTDTFPSSGANGSTTYNYYVLALAATSKTWVSAAPTAIKWKTASNGNCGSGT